MRRTPRRGPRSQSHSELKLSLLESATSGSSLPVQTKFKLAFAIHLLVLSIMARSYGDCNGIIGSTI